MFCNGSFLTNQVYIKIFINIFFQETNVVGAYVVGTNVIFFFLKPKRLFSKGYIISTRGGIVFSERGRISRSGTQEPKWQGPKCQYFTETNVDVHCNTVLFIGNNELFRQPGEQQQLSYSMCPIAFSLSLSFVPNKQTPQTQILYIPKVTDELIRTRQYFKLFLAFPPNKRVQHCIPSTSNAFKAYCLAFLNV